MFLEVARRSPWCRGTPAHVHWSLPRCPPDGGGGDGGGDNGGDGFSPLRFVSPKRRGKRRRTPLPRPTASLLSSIPLRDELPTSSPTTSPPRGPRPPSLLYPPHPLAVVTAAKRSPFPFHSILPLAGHCRHGHYHRLLLRLSSTSNGDDPTHPTVARYYHSVLLAIYRPLSTTLPPNGVYRCCLAA